MENLIELACIFEIKKIDPPYWLTETIKKMTSWAYKIRLDNGTFPIFNDSPADTCSKIDVIIAFAESFLNKKIFLKPNKISLRDWSFKSKILTSCGFKVSKRKIKLYKNPSIVNLNQTGWTFLRPSSKWELIFKTGEGCPRHLPAHVHSDLLSFDIFYRGNPIFIEAGTSTYEDNEQRIYERGTSAHNLLQVGVFSFNKLTWVDPVET